MNVPEIRIQDGWHLRLNASVLIHELKAKPNEKLANTNDMQQIINAYQKSWLPKEKQILNAMMKSFDLSFKENIINVYIAPWFAGFSSPMVIGVKFSPDEFVDILTHELFHRLLTINNKFDLFIDKADRSWHELFGEELSDKTIVHIPVHAGLKSIYLDTLNEPYRLKRDIKNCNKDHLIDYKKAWEYVEENDYKKIIKQIKYSYT